MSGTVIGLVMLLVVIVYICYDRRRINKIKADNEKFYAEVRVRLHKINHDLMEMEDELNDVGF